MRQFLIAEDKLDWLATQFRWRIFIWKLNREAKQNAEFDALHGVDTAAEIDLTKAGVPDQNSARGNSVYRPLWESSFRRILRDVAVDLRCFTFVDIGSGKGKLLLLASEYPFRSILGIEYAPLLHQIATSNLAVFRSPRQKCFEIKAVNADATEYPLPDGPLLCILFNAMDEATTKLLVHHIERHAVSRPEPIYLIYVNLRNVKEIGDGLKGATALRIVRKTRTYVVLRSDRST